MHVPTFFTGYQFLYHRLTLGNGTVLSRGAHTTLTATIHWRTNFMDANNRESAADVDQGSGSVAGVAARMKRSVGQEVSDRIESSRQATVGALEWTASSLHSGTDQISNLGHSAADRIEHTADYIRETDLERIYSEIQRTVRRYPGRSLAIAAVGGFVVARLIRSLAR
jgi:hypothetical protein